MSFCFRSLATDSECLFRREPVKISNYRVIVNLKKGRDHDFSKCISRKKKQDGKFKCMYRTPGLNSPEHQFLTCAPCPSVYPWIRNPGGSA